MRRVRLSVCAAAATVLLGCPGKGCSSEDALSESEQDTPPAGAADIEVTPSACVDDTSLFRTPWQDVLELPFDIHAVETLALGGPTQADNNANRGDVLVLYDDSVDRIRIEARRFTVANDESTAQADIERLEVIAFEGGLPSIGSAPTEDDDCRSGGWKPNCQVRVRYDGLSQPIRTGADLRVTLPGAWAGTLLVETSDNNIDPDFPDLANVCVQGLAGSAEVLSQSGLVWIQLDEDIEEVPGCAEAAECEATAWDSTCPCLGSTGRFGGIRVLGDDGSTDVIVDTPDDLWTSFSLENRGGAQVAGDPAPGASCDVTVARADLLLDDGINTSQTPWKTRGAAARPSETATAGAGYSVLLTSDACSVPVRLVASGEECEAETERIERGNLTLCSGCLGTDPCALLMD